MFQNRLGDFPFICPDVVSGSFAQVNSCGEVLGGGQGEEWQKLPCTQGKVIGVVHYSVCHL